jgi:hypothetical protein
LRQYGHSRIVRAQHAPVLQSLAVGLDRQRADKQVSSSSLHIWQTGRFWLVVVPSIQKNFPRITLPANSTFQRGLGCAEISTAASKLRLSNIRIRRSPSSSASARKSHSFNRINRPM